MIRKFVGIALAGLAASTLVTGAIAGPTGTIDNSAIGQPMFRAHTATYGLVYKLPQEVNDELNAKIYSQLRPRLVAMGLSAEAQAYNIPHVTVLHIHSADPTTPRRMLQAMPKLPPVINLTLKSFYTTEAAKGAGHPWWLDLGIVKSGKSFDDMMAFNTSATAALASLRDGPLPRVTGPVYANMSEAGRDLVKNVGVSGVNVIKDGKEIRSHNPHNTLVYSMTRFDAKLQESMKQIADDFNKILPNGIDTSFREVSIVELGFAGNVLREYFRMNLETGDAIDVATGQRVPGINLK
jgi:hypothetical protein